MAETKNENKNETKAAETKNDNKEQTVDVKALLDAQAKEFKAQMDALAERNNKLAEELANLKSNTAEENRLLGESIQAIAEGKEPAPTYNPFAPNLLYKVHNETAGIDTIMTGDEVEGIIGVVQKHLKEKLVNGEKTVEKHPYTVTLLGDVKDLKEKDLKI